MTGLVQDPAVFERFTEAIEAGYVPDKILADLPSILESNKLAVQSAANRLQKSDIATLSAVYSNLSSLLEIASINGVRIAFDAEQSWYQPALSRIVTLLAMRFNKSDGSDSGHGAPIVYNTYQANLRETEAVIREDLRKAKEGGKARICGPEAARSCTVLLPASSLA